MRLPVDGRTGLLLLGAFGAAGLAVWAGSANPIVVPLAILAGACAAAVVILGVLRALPEPAPPAPAPAPTTILLGGSVGASYGRGELYDTVVRLAIEMRVRDPADIPDEEEEQLALLPDEQFRGWLRDQLDALERVS